MTRPTPTWPEALRWGAVIVLWNSGWLAAGVLLIHGFFELGRHWAAHPPAWQAVAAMLVAAVVGLIVAVAAVYRWAAAKVNADVYGDDDRHRGLK